MADKNPLEIMAEFEQASTALTNFAVLLGDYFKKLQKEGFTRNEALKLVIGYQSILLPRSTGSSNEAQPSI